MRTECPIDMKNDVTNDIKRILYAFNTCKKQTNKQNRNNNNFDIRTVLPAACHLAVADLRVSSVSRFKSQQCQQLLTGAPLEYCSIRAPSKSVTSNQLSEKLKVKRAPVTGRVPFDFFFQLLLPKSVEILCH